MIKFDPPLVSGRFIRRYKRFLADIELESGDIVTAHCTNSGSMKTCVEEGAPVYLSPVTDPKRKTRFTWEMIFINGGWIGVNTGLPNRLAEITINQQQITSLTGYSSLRREVTFENSRFDLMAEGGSRDKTCFIEVKNVTMKVGDFARFPDAVTTRGLKHLETLIRVNSMGMRAVMLYMIQRSDVDYFGVAKDIDPAYSAALDRACQHGVEVIPVQVKVSPYQIVIDRIIPFRR